jgi:cell division protein FtsA
MEGMAELAEEVFHMPVRLGLPKYVGGLSEMVRSPIYSTAVGLVQFGQKLSAEPPVSRAGLAGSRQMILRLKNWFRSQFGEEGQ